ncbi:hypothetical protein [Candidatus Odyssella thessalonicensis]|uniref:hypothetical protein n=1 Tax=Candidatus Odyssella thessalonicensis TaxID=84647 RepID=UPI000225AF2F|nr:hypothetical protein [Candidatus Odyssella thessalonicensis]
MAHPNNKLISFLRTTLCVLLLLISSATAKKNLSEKRETAINRLTIMQFKKNLSDFDRYLKKVIKLYARHIKQLQSMMPTNDKEAAFLLAETENFQTLIQTGELSHDATLDKLKQEHDLMLLLERRLHLASAIKPDVKQWQGVTISDGDNASLTGSADHAPAKKSKREDDIEAPIEMSISVPIDVGKRHGFDKLREVE